MTTPNEPVALPCLNTTVLFNLSAAAKIKRATERIIDHQLIAGQNALLWQPLDWYNAVADPVVLIDVLVACTGHLPRPLDERSISASLLGRDVKDIYYALLRSAWRFDGTSDAVIDDRLREFEKAADEASQVAVLTAEQISQPNGIPLPPMPQI